MFNANGFEPRFIPFAFYKKPGTIQDLDRGVVLGKKSFEELRFTLDLVSAPAGSNF